MKSYCLLLKKPIPLALNKMDLFEYGDCLFILQIIIESPLLPLLITIIVKHFIDQISQTNTDFYYFSLCLKILPARFGCVCHRFIRLRIQQRCVRFRTQIKLAFSRKRKKLQYIHVCLN